MAILTTDSTPQAQPIDIEAWTVEAATAAIDASVQTHGGNGLANEYGLSDLWFVTRLMRTAPVSREMVLNFVAQTSLGLPRSY